MKYLKKYKHIIIIIIIIIIRILISYKLPTFYIKNLTYDDNLTIKQTTSLIEGDYLGKYTNTTLVKGPIYPIFLAITKILNISYPLLLTIIYIIACSTLTYSLKKNIKNKKILFILYILLLFNPISYSSDLFQRLYRNSLSITLLLFFLTFSINIINSKNYKENIINSILLGIVAGIMNLTREDNIWCTIVIIFLLVYKFFKNKNIKTILINLLPITIIYIILNTISLINLHYYNIYTYNELTNSSFKDAYIKIQQIKTDNKRDKISITREDLYKLAETSKVFNTTKKEIDIMYAEWSDIDTNEINNGNMIWALRDFVYKNNKFKDGKEANEYFKKLANEIDQLFKSNTLEKEFVIPSIFLNTPRISDVKNLPKNILNTIKYTISYKNIKSFSSKNLENIIEKENINNYNYNYIIVENYHKTENIITKNINYMNIINIFFKYFSIIFSILSLISIIKYKKKIMRNFIIESIILICYCLIIIGIAYTETTSFPAIRYYYLGNIYILQTIFIVLAIDKINYKNLKFFKTKKH